MTCCTQGIRPTVPVRWRGLDGMVGVYWQAEGAADARGYYLSPDPRIVFFLNDVSSHILMSNRDGGMAAHTRPMMRALYVPAGVPIWSSFTAAHCPLDACGCCALQHRRRQAGESRPCRVAVRQS